MESPPEDYPRHPPPPLREPLPHIFHVLDGKCEQQVRDLLAIITRGRGGGRAGVICKTVPFDNRSSDQLQTQNQDSQYHSAPLLFKQDLSNSYWWFMASFSEFILWREAIKGRRSQWPALSRLHCILQVFGTDCDQDRITWGNPQKWCSDSLPFLMGHLGVRAPYATRRKLRYEANQECGWTQPLFCKVRNHRVF